MSNKLNKLSHWLYKEGFTKEAIAMKALTPSDVHDAADEADIDWDDNEAFMRATEALTGKKHLDDMDPNELQEVLVAIDFYKEINKGLTKEANNPIKSDLR